MIDPAQIDSYFQNSAAAQKREAKNISKHSRKVMLAKLILPSLAAVLAVTLLLFPSLKKEVRDFALDFTITKGDIEKLSIEKTLIQMTDENNRINTFSAKKINETEAGSQKYFLKAPEALMPLNDKETVSIKAPDGIYNQARNSLFFEKNVEADFSRGMTFQTNKLYVDLKKSFAKTSQPVTGKGTLGKLTAEGLEFFGSSHTLSFIGKTHIVIKEEALKKESD